MASVEKFTNEEVSAMLHHNNRNRTTYSNKEINKEKTHLNYSIPLEHGNLNDFEYYKKIVAEKYLYGRGSSREKNAVTAAGWVVTLPKELTGNPDKEREFFQGVFDFVSNRYGKENVINNSIHYDEGGQPHIHIMFVPSTKINHDQIHYKTIKTKATEKNSTGRYEYVYRFKLDEKGERIALKNYAKSSDAYEEKISANDVLNKVELKHFHSDLQSYLSQNGIEGNVTNGTTNGANFTVKELKEFTKNTGLTLDQVKEQLTEKNLLESYIERDSRVNQLETILLEKEAVIENLKAEIQKISVNYTQTTNINFQNEINELRSKIDSLENKIAAKDKELTIAKDKITELEKENSISNSQKEIEKNWESNSWGNSSGWGNKENTIEIGEN